jgi:spore germination cell wall hydrolase CwlJ-like protein
VALNRLRAGRWGKDLTSVLLAPKQFSAWNDPVATFGKGPDAKAFRAIQALARRLLRGEVPDPTGGATHYYNPMVVEPPWAQQLKPVGTIGRHVFYK